MRDGVSGLRGEVGAGEGDGGGLGELLVEVR